MRIPGILLLSACLVSLSFAQTIRIKEPVRFLALGDSYTIGQSVSVEERWPNQLVTEMRKIGYNVAELKIIAQTGWTTGYLKYAINQQMPLDGYNLVALLIGVNNQFSGGNVQSYAVDFEELLQQAIALAGNNPRGVFVLSIPDYAYTPYGKGNPVISAGIDQFNGVNRFITETYNVRYIDITPISRNGLSQPWLVASDGLHPSGQMYALWVQEIVKYLEREVGVSENHFMDNHFSISSSGSQITLQSTNYSAEYRIYNLTGEEVRRGVLPAYSGISINQEGLQGGIYIIRLIAEGNRKVSFKTYIAGN
jgi:lysophospholipase L1-like esterase